MDQAWFERIGPGDLQQLATDIGPVPANVGAVLTLDAGPEPDVETVRAVLERRLAGIPRMRQHLRGVPWGCGRPIWVDDPGFDVGEHSTVVRCPAPGDASAMMAAAVDVVVAPFDRTRPLWRVGLVTGLDGGGLAVVLALHHVLADGIGGLAVLARVVDLDAPPDNADTGRSLPRPRPAPTRAQLRADAWSFRRESLRRLPQSLAALAPALTELGRGRPELAPRCSLNAPTGALRRVAVVRTDLDPVRRVARAHGATVNDALLVAVAAALESLLRSRGEGMPALVVSVPVTARSSASTAHLGNEVGVMAVRVPRGSLEARLRAVARSTAEQKTDLRGSSSALITPAFRLLAAMRLFRPMINRQRLVNTFLTNLPGPDRPVRVAGVRVTGAAPVTMAAGNVAVAFAALSYAGTLAISVIVDPDLVPDLHVLERELARALADVAALGPSDA